jgi:hypothetical protein
MKTPWSGWLLRRRKSRYQAWLEMHPEITEMNARMAAELDRAYGRLTSEEAARRLHKALGLGPSFGRKP